MSYLCHHQAAVIFDSVDRLLQSLLRVLSWGETPMLRSKQPGREPHTQSYALLLRHELSRWPWRSHFAPHWSHRFPSSRWFHHPMFSLMTEHISKAIPSAFMYTFFFSYVHIFPPALFSDIGNMLLLFLFFFFYKWINWGSVLLGE